MIRYRFRSFSSPFRALAWCAVLALFTAAATSSAQACACCANTAWRNVNIEKLDAAKLAEIGKVRFARKARLMPGEADDNGIVGVGDVEEDFTLALARQKDKWVFAPADAKGRMGALTLSLPKTISIFEVDPRAGKDDEKEPVLYKEWKLNANAASEGIFQKTTGAAQKMTPILHGRGNGCTEANQFSHWTLLVHGPVDTYTFYGALEKLPDQ
jgi:hypothetical protein